MTLLCLVVFSMERSTSWKVLAFVLDDFLKNIVQDRLGVVGIVDLRTDSKNVSTLFNVVLEVVVVALVCELSHFDPKK